MRANLDRDIILHLTSKGETDIGGIPETKRKVGLERLRWDGEKIVDLADFSEIWVEKKNGVFVFHAIEVPGSQLVEMSWADRKKVIDDAGTFRCKTQAELEQEQIDEAVNRAKLRRRALVHQDDMNHYILMLVLALIVYNRTQDQPVEAFFDKIIDVIRNIYPLDKVKDDLEGFLGKLKTIMEKYWTDLDNITALKK